MQSRFVVANLLTLLLVLPSTSPAGVVKRDASAVTPTPTGHDQLPDFGLGIDGELTKNGIRFLRVARDGPAARAGLEAGDVMLSVNGVRIRTADDWVDVMSNADGNLHVSVRDVRTGNPVTREVDLR